MVPNIVVDIETLATPVTAADIAEYMEAWEPASNVKLAETIERHRAEAQAGAVDKILKDRRFSLGGKRMISAALGVVRGNQTVDIESFASDDLSFITKGVCEYLGKQSRGGKYNLIGWNHKAFDLPELLKSFSKTDTFPRSKPDKWGVIDLCTDRTSPFNRGGRNNGALRLKDAAEIFGIETLGLDGGAVQGLYDNNDWETIKKYNEEDVRITGQLFAIASMFYTF